MTNLEITQAILYLCPNAIFSLVGADLNNLDWQDTRPKPTKKAVQAAIKEIQAKGIDPLKSEDWEALRAGSLATGLFQKVYASAKQSLPIKCSFDMVQQCVLSTRIEQALEFYLNELITEMGDSLTPDDLEEMQTLLDKSGFKIAIGGAQ